MTAFPPANLPAARTETVRLPALTGPLRSWLLDEPSDAVAEKVIAESEMLRSQATMMMPALRQEALRPASHDDIVRIIKSREQTFGDLRTARTEVEWAAFYADYFEALDGLTASSIEAGMVAYIALPDSQWAPKPGKLAHMARNSNACGRFTRAYNRARAAVEKARALSAPPPVVEVEKPDPEVVKAQLAETLEKLTAQDRLKQAAQKARLKPTPSAPLPAGSHMSAAMRAKLEAEGVIRPLADYDNDHHQDHGAAA